MTHVVWLDDFSSSSSFQPVEMRPTFLKVSPLFLKHLATSLMADFQLMIAEHAVCGVSRTTLSPLVNMLSEGRKWGSKGRERHAKTTTICEPAAWWLIKVSPCPASVFSSRGWETAVVAKSMGRTWLAKVWRSYCSTAIFCTVHVNACQSLAPLTSDDVLKQ